MNSFQKHAAKKAIIKKLLDAMTRAKKGVKNYAETVKGTRVRKAKATQSSAAAKLEELAKAKPATGGRKGKGAAGKWRKRQQSADASYQQSTAKIPKEQAATSKARKQVAGGFVGLAGLGALMAGKDKSAAAKATFSPAMDESPALKGKQSELPDSIQAAIIKKRMAKTPIKKTAQAAILRSLARGLRKYPRAVGEGVQKRVHDAASGVSKLPVIVRDAAQDVGRKAGRAASSAKGALKGAGQRLSGPVANLTNWAREVGWITGPVGHWAGSNWAGWSLGCVYTAR